MILSTLKPGIAFALLAPLYVTTIQAQNTSVKNVVLVHGAWADDLGGKASTTFLSRTAITSASYKSRRRLLKKM